MAIRQNVDPGRVFLRQRKLPPQRTDLVRWHMGRPSSSNSFWDAGYELGTPRLPLRGKPLGHRLLRLERGHQAGARGQSRSGRRSGVPQSDLGLLLVWLPEKTNVYTGAANTNALAANGDAATHSLSPTTYVHAHVRTLSSTTHAHTVAFVEQRNRQHPRTQRQPRACSYVP